MKKNEAGFTGVELLLVLCLLILLGGVGWYVQQRTRHQASDISKSASDGSEEKQNKKTLNEDFVMHETKQGFSFQYPKSWKLVDDSEAAKTYISINSPDHEITEVGYGGTTEGTYIYINAAKISDMGAVYHSIDAIFNNTTNQKGSVTEQKLITIGGLKAVEYVSSYEGPASLTTQIDNEGWSYSFHLAEDIDGPDFNNNIDTYRKIGRSFKLTN